MENFQAVERSIRRLFFRGGRVVPVLFASVAFFVALRPMLFEPDARLDGVLASMAGVGLSFSSVTLAAASALRQRERWSAAMVDAAMMLLRFALATVVALALSAARRRVMADFDSPPVLDWALRGATAMVTALAVGLAFLGFRALVFLIGPGLEDEPAPRHDPQQPG